jgi:hypothetical protein
VRYNGRVLQIPEQRHRHHFVKVTIQVHDYHDGTIALFHGPRRLAGYAALAQRRSKPNQPLKPARRRVLWICG